MATATSPSSFPRLLDRVIATIGAIGETFAFARRGQERFEQLERLQALSDEDLARRGLARQDLVRRVFADLFAE